MKNIFKLSAFILLLCSFVLSTSSIVSADEAKTENVTAADTEKSKDGTKEGDDVKKKKKAAEEEEPECE